MTHLSPDLAVTNSQKINDRLSYIRSECEKMEPREALRILRIQTLWFEQKEIDIRSANTGWMDKVEAKITDVICAKLKLDAWATEAAGQVPVFN